MRQLQRILLTTLLAAVITIHPAMAEQCGIEEEVYPDEYYPSVKLVTSKGDIVIELNRRRAPITVNNFLGYVKSGAYDGTVFHRVVSEFVVQGGGYRPDYSAIDTSPAIFNESGNGLKNNERSIAMARQEDPNTATSQFYFNLAANDSLDPGRRNWGYAVFGSVIEGWEVVQAISAVETGYAETINSTDAPVEPIVLKQAVLVKAD
jgi:cyclophilin family peptidyl-prolyl cis-trans isomerase